MKLTTKRLVIRSMTSDDLPALFSLWSDPIVMRFSVLGPLSIDQVTNLLKECILPHQEEHGFSLCVVEESDSGQMIGCAGLLHQNIDGQILVELGYRFHTAFWGKGFATEAGTALARYAFDVLGLDQMISVIDPGNINSINVAWRLGMSLWKDSLFHNIPVQIWRLKKQDLIQAPSWGYLEVLTDMQTNFVEQMTGLVRYVPSLKQLPSFDIKVVHSSIQDDTYNYVLDSLLNSEGLSVRIAQIVDGFKKTETPFSWWVSPLDTPQRLSEHLLEQGLLLKEKNQGMFCPLKEWAAPEIAPVDSSSSLQFERVISLDGWKLFANVLMTLGFRNAYEEIYSKIPSSVYCGEESKREVYIGLLNGAPVVTGFIVFHAGVAGIYYIATDPQWRKRGFGTAMLCHLLQCAQLRGYEIAVLQASEEGYSLYERLGFRTCCQFIEYAPAAIEKVHV